MLKECVTFFSEYLRSVQDIDGFTECREISQLTDQQVVENLRGRQKILKFDRNISIMEMAVSMIGGATAILVPSPFTPLLLIGSASLTFVGSTVDGVRSAYLGLQEIELRDEAQRRNLLSTDNFALRTS